MRHLLVFLSGTFVEALYAIGVLTINKGRRVFAATSSFVWGLAFAYGLDGSLLRHDRPAILCWCLGLSAGTLLGMWLEDRFSVRTPRKDLKCSAPSSGDRHEPPPPPNTEQGSR